MASTPFDWDAYQRQLADSGQKPTWEDASDLARLSLDTFVGELSPMRRDLSAGVIRLTGHGVDGHAARVDDVATTMRNFQRLVLASAGALEGHKTLRGHLPAQVTARAQLRLNGSAAPGSLILDLVPEQLPGAEITPDGQQEFFSHGESQLIDRAVKDALGLLALSKQVGPDADEAAFLEAVRDRGPRVASTLRDWADGLVSAHFDTDLTWAQPRQPLVRVKVAVAESKHISDLVAARDLEKEPIRLQGVLRTVSDISPLRVEVGADDIVSIDTGDLSIETIRTLAVGMTVAVEVTVTESQHAGGDSTTKFSATSLAIVA